MIQVENPDEVVAVDGHVTSLLKKAQGKYQVDVNPEAPTRQQRFEAAMAIHNREVDSRGMDAIMEAYEIVTGEKCPAPPMSFFSSMVPIMYGKGFSWEDFYAKVKPTRKG